MLDRVKLLGVCSVLLLVIIVESQPYDQDDTNGQRNHGQHNGLNNTGYYNGNDNDGDYNGNNNNGNYNGNNNEGNYNGNDNGGNYNGNNNKGSGRNGNGNGKRSGGRSWQTFLNSFDLDLDFDDNSEEERWGLDFDDSSEEERWGDWDDDDLSSVGEDDTDADDDSVRVSQSISVSSQSSGSDSGPGHSASSISVFSRGNDNQISVCVSGSNYDTQSLSCVGRGVVSSVTVRYMSRGDCDMSSSPTDCDFKTSGSMTSAAEQRCLGKSSCFFAPSSLDDLPAGDLQTDPDCGIVSSGDFTLVRLSYSCSKGTLKGEFSGAHSSTTADPAPSFKSSTVRSTATYTKPSAVPTPAAGSTVAGVTTTLQPVAETQTTGSGELEKEGSCPSDRYSWSQNFLYRPTWCLSLCQSDHSCPADLKCCGNCLKMCTKPQPQPAMKPKAGQCPSYYGIRSSRRYCFKIFPDQCQSDGDCPSNMLCCGDCRKKCLYPAGHEPDWLRRSQLNKRGRGSFYSYFSLPALW